MKKILALFLIAFSSALVAQDGFYDIIVKVEGIQKQEGKIFVALFDSKENFLGKRLGGGSKPVDGNSLVFTFKSMESGTYAISIFHDKNGNGEFDSNFMGIPTEPYAFSNNAKGMFGPPKYEECKFDVLAENKEIIISL